MTVAEAATAPGYTFSGWSTGDFTMPAQDVEITGSFTANGDTAYTAVSYTHLDVYKRQLQYKCRWK